MSSIVQSDKKASHALLVEKLLLGDPRLEDSFHRATRLLQTIAHTPITAFSLIDRNRMLFKSVLGTDLVEIARDAFFCGHTILGSDVFVVSNARHDPRFYENPMVTGKQRMVFYAGVAVRDPTGLPIGSLCAIDHFPRPCGETLRAAMLDLRAILENDLALRAIMVNDPATGLINTHGFLDILQREWRRSLRSGQPISLLAVRFENRENPSIRTRGQAWLNQSADMMEDKLMRGGDFVARTGNTEFMALLTSTDETGASAVCERMGENLVKLLDTLPPWQRPDIRLGHATTRPLINQTYNLDAFMARARTHLEASVAL